MNALLDQLELNHSFLIELAIISILFVILANLFFKPFLKLFEMRHQRTIQDKETAERLLAQANAKMEDYKRLLFEERLTLKKDYDLALVEIKKQEAELLTRARDEAKKITQEAADSVNRQRIDLKKQLESDVETIAQSISDRLLSRNI